MNEKDLQEPSVPEQEEIEEFVSDAISDITGFCHKGFATTPEIK